jgi:ABC-2 type transport system ATP-binding protein
MELELERISKKYGEKVAVDKLSLVVPSGVIYGIIGPNGAGKTTTIRMIMNIIRPDSGRVLYNGREVDNEFTDDVGYLPEERGLYKKMTLQEVISYLAQLKGCSAADARKRTMPWLERMGLAEYRTKKVEELSKGMAQKLQLISTVLHEPDIIILDELFSGLDPVNTELIKDVVLEKKRAGKTILFSTHVMEQAEKLCDHLCMISGGHKVIDGKLIDVKRQFGKNAIHVGLDGDGAFLKELRGVQSVTEFTNYFEINLSDGENPSELMREIVARAEVHRIEVVEPSLYQIFIEMAKVDPSQLEKEPTDA